MNRTIKSLVVVIALLISVTIFQNCSEDVNFATIPSMVEVTKGGECVSGDKLGVWLDPDQSGVALSSNFLGYVVSYSGSESPEANYNYYSASAHPIHGPTPIDNLLSVFFYKQSDSNEIALNTFSNIDQSGGTGGFNTQVTTLNNNLFDSVLLQDDPNEQVGCSQKSGEMASLNYSCTFAYQNNTDGFVIGPFITNNFEIRVSIPKSSNVNQARFYSANGSSFTLKNQFAEISSFIIKKIGVEECP